ncbi:MAG: hypothetical protein PGN27_01245 [Mycolicibacterium neoaurum]|uniref:hypothetical protein n=1 Tax=Mycolicibacterium neoaurum TaxID=1795 RepID=UPI002FFD0880
MSMTVWPPVARRRPGASFDASTSYFHLRLMSTIVAGGDIGGRIEQTTGCRHPRT